MIRAALLSQLGVGQLDGKGYDMVQAFDAATRVTWLAMVHGHPGESVIGNLMRCDPGTLGRTLFHFHAASRIGRHSLAYPCSGEGLASAVLPPLPALCAFFGAARAELAAGRIPDLDGLAPLHLGVAFTLPPIEVRPGDREIRLRFETPEED